MAESDVKTTATALLVKAGSEDRRVTITVDADVLIDAMTAMNNMQRYGADEDCHETITNAGWSWSVTRLRDAVKRLANDALRDDETEFLFNAEGTGQTLRCKCGHLRGLHNHDYDNGTECYVGDCHEKYGARCD